MNTATHEMNGKGAKPASSAPAQPIDVELIDRCPTQPRRTFDEVKLNELAVSLKETGQLQDILVRPSPTTKGRFELVFGERRWRAMKIAGLPTILAKVRNLTDIQVLEIQIVENAKREDIHPLEEADAYHALHTKHGYSIEQIASKVAKSTATVTQRMKLLGLGPEARNAYAEGKFPLAVALVVASLPAGPKQKELVAELTRGGEEPTRADALHVLDYKYRLKLAEATFDRTDAKLVDGAPACGSCPKRTGAQADLFGSSKDDFCLDATCFNSKCDAAWKKRVDAQAENERVLSEKETKKVFANGRLPYDSAYVDLSDKNYVGGKPRSYGELLGKKRDDVEIVLARGTDNKIHELVAKKEFATAVPKAGIRVPTSTTSSKPKSSKSHAASEKDWKKKEQERRAKAEAEAKARREQISAIAAAAAKTAPNDGFWRVVVRALIRMNGIYGPAETLIIETLGVKKSHGFSPKYETQLLTAATKLKGDKARALVVAMLLDDQRDDKSGETHADFRELYKLKAPTVAEPKTAPKAKTKKGGHK